MYKGSLRHIIYFIPLGIFLVVRYGLDFNGLYGQDAHEYLRYAIAIKNYFLGGEFPGPFFWPVNYPLLGAIISIPVKSVSLAMQGASCIALCMIIFFILRLGKFQLADWRSELGLFLGLLLCFIPSLLRSGVAVMSEATMLLFLVMAIFYYLMDIQGAKSQGPSAMFVASAVAAVGTRYAVIVIIAPLILLWMYRMRSRLTARVVLKLLGTAFLVALPNLWLKLDYSWGLTNHDLLMRWSLNNYISPEFHTDNGVVTNVFPNVIYYGLGIFHLKYLWWSLPLLMTKRKWLERDRTVMGVGLIYLVFISGIPEQNSRYLMPLVPLVLVLTMEPLCRWLTQRRHRLIRRGCLMLVIALQCIWCVKELKPMMDQQRFEKEIANQVCAHLPARLYTFVIDQALQTYGCPMAISNLWEERLTAYEIGSLVLFNEDAFRVQWAFENPMINWRMLMEQYHTTIVQDFERGWKLYRVGQKK